MEAEQFVGGVEGAAGRGYPPPPVGVVAHFRLGLCEHVRDVARCLLIVHISGAMDGEPDPHRPLCSDYSPSGEAALTTCSVSECVTSDILC